MGDEITVSTEGLESFMSYEQNVNKLQMINPVPGVYTVTFTLADIYGSISSSQIKITIQQPDEDAVEVSTFVPVVKFDNLLTNFDDNSNNQTANITVEAQNEEEREPIDINITSLSPSGLMTVYYSEKLWSIA